MHTHTPDRRPTRSHAILRALGWALAIAVAVAMSGVSNEALAQEGNLGFSPASGSARVIAQGVVELPQGDAVWRTVRTRALLPADAAFEERPLGFVIASSGPMLLVDQDSGEQVHLGVGEAALVKDGEVQQRSSIGAQPVSYLSVELVSVDAAPPADSATVLQPGQPFVAPPGLHDLDLLIDTLQPDEAFIIPDSGAKNVILIIGGAANVGRPGEGSVVLLAGEAASFSGELQVATPVNAAGAADGPTFVVAMIGPEIPAMAGLEAVAPEGVNPEPIATAGDAAGVGSISVQIYSCPPGMDLESLNAAACGPASGDFDVTLSGVSLAGPLTIGDASVSGDAYVWSGLPFGEYRVAEAVLPSGYSTYALAARVASGSPDAGYRISISETEPDLAVRIYNFAAP